MDMSRTGRVQRTQGCGMVAEEPDDWLFSLRRTWYEEGVIQYNCDSKKLGFKVARNHM